MSMLWEGVPALIIKADVGAHFWLEGYIFTDCHSDSPLVEFDDYSIPDFQDFEPDIAAKLRGRHILGVSTSKIFLADLFIQERVIAELIKAVVYDAKKGVK